jgi:hypothetical protein
LTFATRRLITVALFYRSLKSASLPAFIGANTYDSELPGRKIFYKVDDVVFHVSSGGAPDNFKDADAAIRRGCFNTRLYVIFYLVVHGYASAAFVTGGLLFFCCDGNKIHTVVK